MPEYLSPGVYVEEVDRGPKPIEGVGTAMPVFVGFSEKAQLIETIDGEVVTSDVLGKPQLVTNWSQYVERFGNIIEGAYMPHSVYGYFLNGGGRCYVLSVKTIPKAQAALLGSDGKPQLIVRSKQAGFSGLKLRVKVEAPEAAAAPAAAKKEDDKAAPKSEGSGSSNGSGHSFNVVVERQGTSGAWQTKEVLRDVTLTEVETDA